MRIIVDADACPVKKIIEEEAMIRNIEVIMFLDTSHELKSEYSKIIFVDKSIDSADLAILKELKSGDLVVTQDFGLASLVLSKGCMAINQNGLIFTEFNIERLLFERFISKENRRMKIRSKNMKKRSNENDSVFREVLLKILDK